MRLAELLDVEHGVCDENSAERAVVCAGCRDNDYFFLKIQAAFPGKMRCTIKKPHQKIDEAIVVYLQDRSTDNFA